MKKAFLLTSTLIITLALMIGLSACGEAKENESKENENKSEEVAEEGETENSEGEEDLTPDDSLIVATEAGFPPFEYVDDNGEIVGVDIDIAQAIADKLGKELVIKNMSFDGALVEVADGRVDMVAAGVSVTDERKESMDFSVPYFESYQVMVVNAKSPAFKESTLENIKGKIITAQQGSVGDVWVTDKTEAAEVRRFNEIAVAASEVELGKADALILDNVVAHELVANNQDKLMIADGEPISIESTAIALPKGSDELKEVVNEVITELKENGQIEKFLIKHKKAGE